MNSAPVPFDVLQNAAESSFRYDPFPHMVVKNALPRQYYDSLMENFPSIETVNIEKRQMINNNDCFLGTIDVVNSDAIGKNWKEFFTYHVSSAFFWKALSLIAEPFRRLHPDVEKRIGKRLEELSVAVAGGDKHADAHIQCQFGVNSPVTRESSVRTAHVDNPQKLFNALLYCRADNDMTPGGDLILYKFRKKPGFYNKRTALPTRIEEVISVPYQANTLVLFLNSPESVHGVSPRPPTPHIRRYINFQVELSQPLFELPRVNPVLGLIERYIGR